MYKGCQPHRLVAGIFLQWGGGTAVAVWNKMHVGIRGCVGCLKKSLECTRTRCEVLQRVGEEDRVGDMGWHGLTGMDEVWRLTDKMRRTWETTETSLI